jgi:uncharacterized membrane protein YfcA
MGTGLMHMAAGAYIIHVTIAHLLATLIALAALFVRGFSGFGASLVMMPTLMVFLDVKTAVVAAAITQVPVGFHIAYQARSEIDRPSLILLLPPSVVGIVVGSLALIKMDSDLLKRIFGAITILFALRIIWSLRYPATANRKWPSGVGILAGALGGVLGGAFGTSGPPVIVFLEQQILSKDMLRATLLAYFLVIDGLRLISYAFSGLFTWQAITISLAMIPAALVGAHLGTRLNTHVDEHTFRVAVGALLFATGGLLMVGG